MSNHNAGGTEQGSGDGSGGLARGATVGRYLVVGLIGKGGAGEVYAAYDPELDRKIALKLLRAHAKAGIDPSEGRARLLREAQAIARLSDPNVVVVFDVGTVGERVFLAMEFVDGTTLGYWCQAKPRGWREVVTTFSDAGRGLASAHKAGLIHRDFKPDNVMIGRDGKVRVMDFGLARVIEPDAEGQSAGDSPRGPTPSKSTAAVGASRTTGTGAPTPRDGVPPAVSGDDGNSMPATIRTGPGSTSELDTSTRDLSRDLPRDLSRDLHGLRTTSSTLAMNSPMTETGAIMGTPAYMAPEQFQGAAVDARTDQFSFCVALYEALYGQRPFAGWNLVDLAANVTKGVIRDTPPAARVPGWLRKVVLRGLRVERADRHASMDVLLAALARDPTRSRTRWVGGAMAMGLIVVLAASVVRMERRQRTQCLGGDAKLAGVWELPSKGGLSPRKEAIRRAFMATGKRYAGDSFVVVKTALDRYVTAWSNMHRDACEATNLRGEQSAEVMDLRMSCLQDRFSEVRALAAVFSDPNGAVVSKAVGATEALKPIDQCADIVTLRAVVRPPDDPAVRRQVADVRSRLADLKALMNAGKYKKALDQVGPITEAARITSYQAVIAEALLQSANLDTQVGDASKAETAYEQALWMADTSRHDEVVVEAAAQLIYVVGYMQGRYADGERWGRHAAAALGRLGPGHDMIAGWRANNLGLMYGKEGRLEDSLAVSLDAVTLKTRALGAAHFDVGLSHFNVALALFRLGRVDEAIDRNERGLRILRSTVGPDSPRVAIGLSNTAELLNAKGRHGEARDMAFQAIAIWERDAGLENTFLAYPLTVVGETLVDTGQPALAIPYLERALRIREGKDPEADLLGETRFALARALWESNLALDRAMTLAKKARSDYGGSPIAQKQRADVDGWIDTHSLRVQRTKMR